jgi:hypothetical protein
MTAFGEWHILQTITNVSLPGASGKDWARAPKAMRQSNASFTGLCRKSPAAAD